MFFGARTEIKMRSDAKNMNEMRNRKSLIEHRKSENEMNL